MRVILDTELKKTICPKAFFDNIRKLNEASALTGRKEEIDIKEYLNSIIEDCRKDIINEKDVPKRTRTRTKKQKLGTLEIAPNN